MPEPDPTTTRNPASKPKQAFIGALSVTLAGILGPMILGWTGIELDNAQLAGLLTVILTAVAGSALALMGSVARDKEFEYSKDEVDAQTPNLGFVQRNFLKVVFKLFGLT